MQIARRRFLQQNACCRLISLDQLAAAASNVHHLAIREPGNDGAHTRAQCGRTLWVTHSGAAAPARTRGALRGCVVPMSAVGAWGRWSRYFRKLSKSFLKSDSKGA